MKLVTPEDLRPEESFVCSRVCWTATTDGLEGKLITGELARLRMEGEVETPRKEEIKTASTEQFKLEEMSQP